MLRRTVVCGLLTAVWMVASGGLVSQSLCAADGEGGGPKAALSGKGSKGTNGKTPSGRLPPHYSKVVTQEQRVKIYEIQAEFKSKIDAARDALEALIKERNERISAVLTPEQKKQIEDAAVNSKRKKTGSQPEEASSGAESTEPSDHQ
jgi:hypothetical protein